MRILISESFILCLNGHTNPKRKKEKELTVFFEEREGPAAGQFSAAGEEKGGSASRHDRASD
jgi:hypothetical protein